MMQQWKWLKVLHFQPSGQNRWLNLSLHQASAFCKTKQKTWVVRDQTRSFKVFFTFVSFSDFLSDSPGDQMNLSVPPGNICDDVRTQQECRIPTNYILNNVLDLWCWQNTVSWRFDCDRLTDFRWRAVIRDPLNPFYRTDSHSAVWLQAADRSSDRNITSELNQYKWPDLVLHHSNCHHSL